MHGNRGSLDRPDNGTLRNGSRARSGISSCRQDFEEDSFGLVALSLIVPIITVLVLGMFFTPSGESAMSVPSLIPFQILPYFTGPIFRSI